MTKAPAKITTRMSGNAKPAKQISRRKRATAKPTKKAKDSSPIKLTAGVPGVTKRQQLADLLTRDAGATLDQMVAATGWLPHTVRAALTGLRRAGYRIDSDRVDGLRTWRAVAP